MLQASWGRSGKQQQGQTSPNHVQRLFLSSVEFGIAQPITQAYDQFQIDQLRSQKDEDLERYRKDIERRSRQLWGNDEYFDQSHKYNWSTTDYVKD